MPHSLGREKSNKHFRQRIYKSRNKISYQPCAGVMIAFESKVKERDAKVGKNVADTDCDMTMHLYEGKLKGILKSAVKPNG